MSVPYTEATALATWAKAREIAQEEVDTKVSEELGTAAAADIGTASGQVKPGDWEPAWEDGIAGRPAVIAAGADAAAARGAIQAAASAEVNARDFGITGSGDETAKFQTFVNHVVTTKSRGVIPFSQVQISSTIDFPLGEGWSIRGLGRASTTILMTTDNVPIFRVGVGGEASGTAGCRMWGIEDMCLRYQNNQPATNTNANCLLTVAMVYQISLRGLWFFNGFYGWRAVAGQVVPWGGTYEDLYFNKHLTGGAINWQGVLNDGPNNKFGRLFVEAQAMQGPIFLLQGHNSTMDAVEIIRPDLGPQAFLFAAKTRMTIGAIKVEAATYTAARQIIQALTQSHIEIGQLRVHSALNNIAPISGEVVLLGVGGGGNGTYVRIGHLELSGGTNVNAYAVNGQRDNRVLIDSVAIADGWKLTNTANSQTAEMVRVESYSTGRISINLGDANHTAILGGPNVLYFETALTAPREVILPSDANMMTGSLTYEVVSAGAVNGANTLTIKSGSRTIHTMSADNTRAVFTWRRNANGANGWVRVLEEIGGSVVSDLDDVPDSATRLAMTTAERTKLAGVADGAEPNVQADWNAASGDAQILNKPTLGTAATAAITEFAPPSALSRDPRVDSIVELERMYFSSFLAWCKEAGARPHIGEISVPWGGAEPRRWATLLHHILAQADSAGVESWAWSARKGDSDLVTPWVASSGTKAGTLDTDRSAATGGLGQVHQAHAQSGSMTGVALATGHSGFPEHWSTGASMATYRGTWGQTYTYGSAGDFAYLRGLGFSKVRLMVRWERLQPTLNGPLDSTEVARLVAAAQAAQAAGLGMVICPKQTGIYYEDVGGVATPRALGSVELPVAAFADFWGKLAPALPAAVTGFDLMNEPHYAVSVVAWEQGSQAALTAVRNTGDTRPIYVEGGGFNGVWDWTTRHSRSGWITDPADNFFYSAHWYPGPGPAYDKTLNSYALRADLVLAGTREARAQGWATGEIRVGSPELAVNGALTSGRVYIRYFTAPRDMTVSSFVCATGTPAAAGLTVARMALATATSFAPWDGLTIVAETDNAAATFSSATFSRQTIPMSTARGGPASYRLAAGHRYAILLICTGTTMPGILKQPIALSSLVGVTSPRIAMRMDGQTDLPTPGGTITTAAMTNPQDLVYHALVGVEDEWNS